METANTPHTNIFNEEVIYQNPLLYLKIWEIQSGDPAYGIIDERQWHYHKEVEFLAICEGHLAVHTQEESTVLGPGDVMVLGSSQLHRTNPYTSDPLRYIVFQVDLRHHFDSAAMPYLYAFSELTRPLYGLNYIFRENDAARRECGALILDIHSESQRRLRGYELAISSAIRRLMMILLRGDTRGLTGGADDSELTRLRPALDYIDRHLGDKIAVEAACGLLNLSYHYFIKYFKKTMGLSFVDYVNYRRIKEAERMLLTRDLSIMEIAYEVGVPNMAQFYKLFKRHNQCSPKEFRHRMKGQALQEEAAANG